MLVLTNIYKDMDAIMSQFIEKLFYKLLSVVLLTNFDDFAYNMPYSVNLLNQQTDHKSHTPHIIMIIGHVSTCISVTNSST